MTFGASGAVYYANSSDGGQKFTAPVEVGAVTKLALGMRRGPRITAGSDAIVVAAIGHEDGNVLAWRSTNEGRTWQGPVQVNDAPRDAREGLHALARGPRGAVWRVAR